MEQFGILQCKSQGCEDEKSFFGIETARTIGPGRIAVASATASATASTVIKVDVESVAPTDNSSPPLRQTSPQMARIMGELALADARELKL